MNILGIRVGHDSSAALLKDGKLVADVSEERFSRIKNDTSFPLQAINYCLRSANLKSEDIDIVAIPEDEIPLAFNQYMRSPGPLPIERYAVTHSFAASVRKRLASSEWHPSAPGLPLYLTPVLLSKSCRVHLTGHHDSHAASACMTNPWHDESLVAVLDGRGGGISSSIWKYQGGKLTLLHAVPGQGSLGWFFSNCTEGMDWRHGCDEWKVMGLAPYGTPARGCLKGFHPEYRDGELVQGREYGKFSRINDHGSNHYHGRDAADIRKIVTAVGRENFSAEAQLIVEEQASNFILPWVKRTGIKNLSCAGGVFLNVKLNQRLWESGTIDSFWAYPNPGDAGLAVGAALRAWGTTTSISHLSLTSLASGPCYSDDEIAKILTDRQIGFTHHPDITEVAAELLAENKVIAWFQGRMEAGPRALGQRSILMNPGHAGNKDLINSKVKYREAFRPFCPSVLFDRAQELLENYREERFMLATFTVKPEWRERIPAVVHADNTTRPQMVHPETHPLYHRLIDRFCQRTGIPLVLNTSLNIKGEPIVCTPRDAIKCFVDTGIDALCIGSFLVRKPIF